MAPDVPHLVAAIRPDVFCQPRQRAAVKRLLGEALAAGDRNALLQAAARAEPVEPNALPLERLELMNPFDLPGQLSPVEEHTLTLDRTDEPLEPIYFNLLDELSAREGWVVEKLVDTVNATPGSGLSADLKRRMMMQQQEVNKVMTQMHRQVRGVLSQWQKWREHKRQLALYDQAKASENHSRQTALSQLRYRWKKENGLMVASTEPLAEEEPSFNAWLSSSAVELSQRLELDRQLLANELNLLKLQANWIRPYLQPHQDARRPGDPALVTAFNTAVFDVVLLVAPLPDLELAVQAGELPDAVLNPRYRRPWPIVTVSMRFRVVPERSTRGAYGFRGRVEITFTSYALNQDELATLRRELQRGEWGEALGLLEQATSTGLENLLKDLDELLAEKPSEPPQPISVSEDSNPFSALFSCLKLFTSTPPRPQTSASAEPFRPDKGIERVLRSFALLEARARCLELYEQQKRLRQMPVLGD